MGRTRDEIRGIRKSRDHPVGRAIVPSGQAYPGEARHPEGDPHAAGCNTVPFYELVNPRATPDAIARGTLDITRITPPLECWDDALTTETAFELVSGLSLFCVNIAPST